VKGEKPSNDAVEEEISVAEEAVVAKNLNNILENEVESSQVKMYFLLRNKLKL
jgi:hypothetical protein